MGGFAENRQIVEKITEPNPVIAVGRETDPIVARNMRRMSPHRPFTPPNPPTIHTA